jgi:hypothetical protein
MAIQQVLTTDTFETWRVKFNTLATDYANATEISNIISNVTTLQNNNSNALANITLLRNNVTLLRGAVVLSGSNVSLGNVTGRQIFVNGNNGHVGINTTNPRANLEIEGNISISSIGSAGSVILAAQGGSSSNVTYTLPNADGTTGQALTTAANGLLYWSTFSSSGGSATGIQSTVAINATETINVGNVVNIYTNAGAFALRNAKSLPGYEAHGFCLANVNNSQTCNIMLSGINPNVSALSPGIWYLSNIAGRVTNVAPVYSGNIVQRVGIALTTTSYFFNPQPPITVS